MATKRFSGNLELGVLAGTEVIPATSVDGGLDVLGDPVSAGTDVKLPLWKLFGMAVSPVTIAGGVATVNCAAGFARNFTLALTANAALAVSNLAGSGKISEFELQITQDAAGGRTLALPAAFKALGGSDTAISSAPNSVTILSAKTFDNGTTWRYAMQESA